jgi:threonine aldolase
MNEKSDEGRHRATQPKQSRIRGFASDNNSGIHPRILKAIDDANHGHFVAYGDDPFTKSALDRFKEVFGSSAHAYFVFTGTGANVLGLKAICSSHESVICTSVSHLNVDECGAPEHFIGVKLLAVATEDGKLSPQRLEPFLHARGNEHHSQPRVVSVTQPTELGTVYSLSELAAIGEFSRANELLFHMDGARLANAAASLGCGLRELTAGVGVDVLSFGGTKNGMMIGEAVVLFNPAYSLNFKFIRKQGMQLASKMRFISAQFSAYLGDGLWLQNARHANAMAALLASELKKVPGCAITQKVQANGVFLSVPRRCVDELRKRYFFYIIDEAGPVIRLMTSFDTGEEEIGDFVSALRNCVEQ